MEELQEYLKEKLNEFRKTYNAEYHLNTYSDRELKRQLPGSLKMKNG